MKKPLSKVRCISISFMLFHEKPGFQVETGSNIKERMLGFNLIDVTHKIASILIFIVCNGTIAG